MSFLFQYLWNILITLDRLVNVILLGEPEDTVSHRTAKAKSIEKKWGCIFCKVLDFIDRDHCHKVIAQHKSKWVADILIRDRNIHWTDSRYVAWLIPSLMIGMFLTIIWLLIP
jgi:hypothetical protein